MRLVLAYVNSLRMKYIPAMRQLMTQLLVLFAAEKLCAEKVISVRVFIEACYPTAGI